MRFVLHQEHATSLDKNQSLVAQRPVGGGGGNSNTSVVHICDQRFSKHTLIEICPFEEKNPKQEF